MIEKEDVLTILRQLEYDIHEEDNKIRVYMERTLFDILFEDNIVYIRMGYFNTKQGFFWSSTQKVDNLPEFINIIKGN